MTFESVHPRLRGELLRLSGITSVNAGSSPLTRGTLKKTVGPTSVDRFIPAYAGNSRLIGGFSSMKSVHPRLRGELRLKKTNWS